MRTLEMQGMMMVAQEEGASSEVEAASEEDSSSDGETWPRKRTTLSVFGLLAVCALAAGAAAVSYHPSTKGQVSPRQLLEGPSFTSAAADQLIALSRSHGNRNISATVAVPSLEKAKVTALVNQHVQQILARLERDRPDVTRALDTGVDRGRASDALNVLNHAGDERVVSLGLTVAQAVQEGQQEGLDSMKRRVRARLSERHEEIDHLRAELLPSTHAAGRATSPDEDNMDLLFSPTGLNALTSVNNWDVKFYVARPSVAQAPGPAMEGRRLMTAENEQLAKTLSMWFGIPLSAVAGLMLTLLIPVLDSYNKDTGKYIVFGLQDIMSGASCGTPALTSEATDVLAYIPCMIEATFAGISSLLLFLEEPAEPATLNAMP